jgi:major membrane immunogen (membrane-anchored lipoprotein)
MGPEIRFEMHPSIGGFEMKRVLSVVLCILAVVCLAACGGGDSKNPAGEYKAESPKDTYGNSAELVITLGEDGKITGVDWKEYANGTLKDKDYGKDLGEEQYQAAQTAIAGSATYPKALLDTQDINKVEAVAGATQSHTNFVQLYNKAMEKK